MSFSDRLQHAWNAFLGRDPTNHIQTYYGGSSQREDRHVYHPTTERTQVSTIYNRISLDVAANNILHVQCDKDGNFESVIESGFNKCLTLSANIDQIGREFIKDIVYSMCEEGAVAVVPIETTLNPKVHSYDILNMRVGQILEWQPKDVKVKVYNENTGQKEDIWVPKSICAIVNNPFYEVMNAPNSTLKRLISKMALLDMTDNKNSSGKLDMIIQLPYLIKSESRREQAEKRRKELEDQLVGSKYGIAYADGTERIIQLNRAVENNLYEQVKDLKTELYTELGITEGILNGTASEQEQLNYQQHTIKPILEAICIEMKRKFLTKNARTRGQSVMYFNNPFGIVPVSQIAEIADKFTRNEIMSSNEFRSVIGYKPVKDPRADELRNKNLNASNDQLESPITTEQVEEDETVDTKDQSQEPRLF
jgi:hypothetical protein